MQGEEVLTAFARTPAAPGSFRSDQDPVARRGEPPAVFPLEKEAFGRKTVQIQARAEGLNSLGQDSFKPQPQIIPSD